MGLKKKAQIFAMKRALEYMDKKTASRFPLGKRHPPVRAAEDVRRKVDMIFY